MPPQYFNLLNEPVLFFYSFGPHPLGLVNSIQINYSTKNPNNWFLLILDFPRPIELVPGFTWCIKEF